MREAVPLPEGLVEAALGVHCDQDRYLVGGLQRSNQLAQLMAGLDIARLPGPGVQVVKDNRPDVACGDGLDDRPSLLRVQTAEADHDHLPDAAAKVGGHREGAVICHGS